MPHLPRAKFNSERCWRANLLSQPRGLCVMSGLRPQIAANTYQTPTRVPPALLTKTGEVLGKTAERHTSAEFIAFITDIVINQPRGKEIHVIADNLSAHKSQQVKDFLGCASEGSPALHSDLFILAQPGRALVRQGRTRCHRPRCIHFHLRPEEKTHALHPSLRQGTSDREMEICRFIAPHRYTISWYRPLERAMVECDTGGSIEIMRMVAAGFLRLATNPKVFVSPMPISAAIAFIDSILATPGVDMPEVGREWPTLKQMSQDHDLAANDITDAWIAAAVRTIGSHLVTFDRGFARLLSRTEFTLLEPS